MKGNKFFKKTEPGYILAFAMIVCASLLIIAISVSQVINQELFFTRLVYNNHNAYFAADSGIQCAEYIDNVYRDQALGVSLFLNSLTSSAKTSFYNNAAEQVFFASSSLGSDLSINNVVCASDESSSYNIIFTSTPKGNDLGYVADRATVIQNLEQEKSSFTVVGNSTSATTTFGFIIQTQDEDDNKTLTLCALVDFYKEKNTTTGLTKDFTITATGYSSCNPNDQNRVIRTIYRYSTF